MLVCRTSTGCCSGFECLFEKRLEGSADSDRAFARRSRFDLRLSLKTAASSFLLGCRQHLLAGRRQLVGLLGETGDDAPAARRYALAVFLVVAHPAAALFGGRFLREGTCSTDGLGSTDQRRGGALRAQP